VIALAELEENRKWVVEKDDIKIDYEILPGWHFYIQSKEVPIHLNRGIFKIFWKYNPDIVITSGYDSLTYWQAFLYCKILGKKFVIWNGSNLLTTKSKDGIRGKLKHIIIKNASGCIAYGTKAKEYLEYFGANPGYIYISRNTVDMSYFRNRVFRFRNSVNFRKERQRYPKYLLLYVGRLTRGKDIIYLLRCFKKLQEEGIKDWGMILVGDGPQQKEIEKFINKNNVRNIYSPGFLQKEEIPFYFALDSCFIC
jgi:glycosyltransferase involved in cell wall biosynthesis